MDKKQERLVLNIYGYARRKLLYETLSGLFRMLLLLSVIWLGLAIADQAFYFSKITRAGFWIINFIFIVYLINKYPLKNIRSFIRLRRGMDLTSTAFEIGREFPEIKDELAISYNLMVKKTERNVSTALLKAAILRTLESLGDIDFKKRIKLRSYLPKPFLLSMIIFSAAVILLFKGPDVLHSVKRLLNPFNDYLKIPAYKFEVNPGDVTLVKGAPLHVAVTYSGPKITGAKIIFSDKKLAAVRLAKESGSYNGKITNLKRSVDYRIQAAALNRRKYGDKIVSPFYHINILIPPMVEKFDIAITPPAYTRLPKEYLDRNIGDISALNGSTVRIKLSANKLLSKAEIRFASGINIPLKTRGESANGEFKISGDDRYKIIVHDTSGQMNIKPIEYRIQAVGDNVPFVDVVQPGEDVETALDVSLPLKIKAEDDFGLAKAYLVYRIIHTDTSIAEKEKKTPLDFAEHGKLRQEIGYLWDFNTLPLAFGDRIKYYAQVYDNNHVSGPGVGRSKDYFVRFPSVDDLFDAFSEQEEEHNEELKDVKDQSDDLKKKLEEIKREMKKSRKMDWQTKQKIEQSIEQQKELQKKVEKVRKDIEKMVEKLEKNNLISKEVLEKYMKLQEMFKNLATPELLESMKQLQKQIDKNSNPREMQRALENFKLNQEAFKERIERTMELLKQVQFEQEMDRLVQKAEKLARQQEKITKKLNEKSLSDEDKKNLKNMQQQQKNNLESLERDMANMLQNPRLRKYKETQKMLDEVDKTLKQGEMQKSSENIERQISENKMANAQKKSAELQRNMQEIGERMKKAQQKMGEQNKADLKNEMLTVMQQLLRLSKEQEKIYRQTKNSSDYSIRQRELAERQSEVLNNFHRTTSEIVKLSQKTFFMDKNISKALSAAEKGMRKSLADLTERGLGSQAAREQRNAMAGLNQSFMKMQGSLGKLSKSSSGTGFEEFMQQLQQMAQGQGQINEQSLKLMPGEQGKEGGMLPSQQQQLARRLAAEQQALQQALKELTDKMGDRKDMLGRIGDAAGDMEEVIQDLIKNRVDRRTIERQRQILSRLLDAQKSARQREYSKKRKSETAKKYYADDPGSIENPYDKNKKYIEDALKRALNEGYNADYKKLIESYFKELEK
jgi:hypothetical protein